MRWLPGWAGWWCRWRACSRLRRGRRRWPRWSRPRWRRAGRSGWGRCSWRWTRRPPRRCRCRGWSGRTQQLAEMACRAGSFQEAHDLVLAATGVSMGKRQLEEIVARAAADAEEFAAGWPVPGAPVTAGPDGEERLAVLGMSADAKGVSMRPDALRGHGPQGRQTGAER